MPNGAWLLLGIGCALVLGTLLVVFIIPSDRRRRPPRFTPPRLTLPRFTIPVRLAGGLAAQGIQLSVRAAELSASSPQRGWPAGRCHCSD